MKQRIFLFLVSGLLTVSCAMFSKKSDIDGPSSSDIMAKDIDSDPQGSDSGNLDGLETVYFAYDSSVLSEGTREILKSNVKWMKENKRVDRMELEGHCDSMGSEAYNIGLGLRRAQAVRNFLISLGVKEDQLSIVSYGEERPISTDNSKNRRVNFVPIY